MFQSRNRESYLFKFGILLLPSLTLSFQSRNRETYLFKDILIVNHALLALHIDFNLGIEKLIFSRDDRNIWCLNNQDVSISESRNLSFQVDALSGSELRLFLFQSRNRETYLFKSLTDFHIWTALLWFQSRNRETYPFKSAVL